MSGEASSWRRSVVEAEAWSCFPKIRLPLHFSKMNPHGCADNPEHRIINTNRHTGGCPHLQRPETLVPRAVNFPYDVKMKRRSFFAQVHLAHAGSAAGSVGGQLYLFHLTQTFLMGSVGLQWVSPLEEMAHSVVSTVPKRWLFKRFLEARLLLQSHFGGL